MTMFTDSEAFENAKSLIHLQLCALESAANGIVITDRAGVIVWVNPAFTQLTGYTRDEVVGQNPRVLKSGEHAPAFYRELWKCILAGQVWRGEMVNRRKDGSLYYEAMSITPVREDNGEITHFIAIKEDVTERKRAEEQVTQLHQELVQRAQDLAAANRELEAFAYSVSHDLRAPLSMVQNFTALLSDEHTGQLDPTGQTYLKLARANTEHTLALLEGLLAFARMSRQELKKEVVDPGTLVQAALATLKKEQEGRAVNLHIGNLPACEGDPVLLKQVWVNLISNALKYTRTRAVAEIDIGSEPCDRNPGLLYFVQDNGIGFDMGEADRLFDVFQRLHSAVEYEGTGVGLAIVQRIIHRHGGRIWAESQLNKGARFCFILGARGEQDERAQKSNPV